MSMLSEQAKELRTIANNLTIGHNMPISLAIERFRQAADTIEALSAKVAAANMERLERYYNGGWIACEDRLPDKTGTYLTTSRIYFVPDHVDEPGNYIGVKMTTFSKNFGWNGEEIFAWQPLPEPYRP